MRKTFGMVIALLLFLGACIYIVFSSPVPTITHIKFEGDKSFIIGINNQDRVTIFRSLDNDKTFNLQLFDKKKLEDATLLIKNRMKSETIDVTIFSMNETNNERLIEIIKKNLSNIVVKEPKIEDLVAYSDEVAYDLEGTYKKEDIIEISREIGDSVKEYIDKKLIILESDDIDTIKEKVSTTDFTTYDLKNYDLSKYNLTVYPYSSYNIEFNYNEEFTYTIKLNLELKEIKDSRTEIYKYTYNHSTNELSDYKTIFYQY